MFCPLLATVGDVVLQQSILKDDGSKMFYQRIANEHFADVLLFCWKLHICKVDNMLLLQVKVQT